MTNLTTVVRYLQMFYNGNPAAFWLMVSFLALSAVIVWTTPFCQHCGKVIDNRDYEGWKHEDGEALCELDSGEFEATPIHEVTRKVAA